MTPNPAIQTAIEALQTARDALERAQDDVDVRDFHHAVHKLSLRLQILNRN